ncbi:cation:proton antiporter [Companilactobacillus metriopterae]|uniref:cation:proton antiporter n=1 Tax=Companilactobacillus metriopterae TaxID=1909267 RepID=UPI00100ABDA6|nr:sodium:proton antiporter [Companilactobacillus metriopterae]
MHILESVILIVALLLIANIISNYFISIPPSLIQIGAGILAALFMKVKIQVNTEWFMLAFIAPILFNDGNRFPKKELWNLRGPILGNAILLVFLSTIVGGILVKILIPGLPLAAAFTLVAVLSPTDPVAVQSIAQKTKLPDSLMHLISGESLINDASGLIAFKYGVAATVTGAFSLRDASLDFLAISFGGAFVGAVMIWLFNGLRLWMVNQGIDDTILHVILVLLIPFVIYYVADEVFGVSGVVAVVVAGILNINTRSPRSPFSPEIRLMSARSWDMLVYLLNGFVFVLLGVEVPFAMRELVANDQMNTFRAIFLAFVIWIILVVIRFIWSFVYTLTFGRKRNKEYSVSERFFYSLLSGISGVRGSVTMVGILSLPFVTNNGSEFPARTLLLFLASGVIIFSLLGATILIPLLTNRNIHITYRGNFEDQDIQELENSDDDSSLMDSFEAQKFVYEKTIEQLRAESGDDSNVVYSAVIAEYLHNLQHLQYSVSSEKIIDGPISKKQVHTKKGINLWKTCFNSELEAAQQLLEEGKISEESYNLSVRRIGRYKRELVRGHRNKTLDFINSYVKNTVKGFTKLIRWSIIKKKAIMTANREDFKLIAIAGSQNAIVKLNEIEETNQFEGSEHLVENFKKHYENRIDSFEGRIERPSDDFIQEKSAIDLKALSYQRAFLQDLLEAGKINRSIANDLRQNINYSEELINLDH